MKQIKVNLQTVNDIKASSEREIIFDSGNLAEIKALFFSAGPEVNLKHWARDCLESACIQGYSNVVEYLCETPELGLDKDDYNGGFLQACHYSRIPIMTYLLTSARLTQHADVHAFNNITLLNACYDGRLEVARFLLASPLIDDHIDLHDKSQPFLESAINSNRSHIVNFLLYDMKMDIGSDFHATLNPDLKQSAVDMVRKRDLFFRLNDELSHQQEKTSTQCKI